MDVKVFQGTGGRYLLEMVNSCIGSIRETIEYK